MTLVGIGFVPAAPLLVPAVAGGSAPLDDDLRGACRRVARDLVAAEPSVVAVLAAGPAGRWPGETPWSTHGFGVGEASSTATVPWPLGAGGWLLDDIGWAGGREYVAVPEGGDLVVAGEVPGRLALLVVGDGSACRSEKAPGHLDPRAEGFDDHVAGLLRGGDAMGLATLDPVLAADLMSSGAPVWRAVAASLGPVAVERADLHYAKAPYGVCYFAARWCLQTRATASSPG